MPGPDQLNVKGEAVEEAVITAEVETQLMVLLPEAAVVKLGVFWVTETEPTLRQPLVVLVTE